MHRARHSLRPEFFWDNLLLPRDLAPPSGGHSQIPLLTLACEELFLSHKRPRLIVPLNLAGRHRMSRYFGLVGRGNSRAGPNHPVGRVREPVCSFSPNIVRSPGCPQLPFPST